MTTSTLSTAELSESAQRHATRLATPGTPSSDAQPWTPHSLTAGSAGIALLHIERAHAGCGTWQQAHRWISSAVAGPVSAADTTGLYLGAPAIAFMLDAAAAGSTGRYRDGIADVDGHVTALAHRRAQAGMARIRAGALPGFREYDVFFGLSGIGALLLRRDPGGSAMERVLNYLVALTRPLHLADQVLPGWWVDHDPHRRRSAAYRDGHANFGAAHGAAGPLALLSQAMRHGITVEHQDEAIDTLCAWFDSWRQDGVAGPWWPEWITRREFLSGRPHQRGPARPSWCYGTPGIARAGQLAAIATDDRARQHDYELALLQCLDDPTQQARIADGGLCHGWAGLFQTVWRAAHDSPTSGLADHLPRLATNLHHQSRSGVPAAGPGLLAGAAGTALALHTAALNRAPTSGWDACLLIN